MSEPGAGSDLAGIRTPARRDGADWILNGSKTFISAGFNSDLVIMVARRHGRSGLMLRLLQHPTTTQLRSVTVADRVREDRCHPTGGSSRKSLNNFRAKPSDQVGDAVADAGGDPVTDLLFGFAVALTEAVVDAGERGFGVAQGALAGPPDPAISSPRPTRAGANSSPAGAAELAIVVTARPAARCELRAQGWERAGRPDLDRGCGDPRPGQTADPGGLLSFCRAPCRRLVKTRA